MIALLRLLLPALVPSWRFFKSVQPSPRVYWQYEGDTDWQEFRPRPAHISPLTMARRLVWNPRWNEALYAVSLAERLTVDPTPHAENEMFRLIMAQADRAGALRFRLIFVTRDTRDITFQSPLRDRRS